MNIRRKFAFALLASCAAVNAVAGQSAFAHGGNNDPNAIHACVNRLGEVRILGFQGLSIDGPCPLLGGPWSAVHWGIVGPSGPSGASGPSGPKGTTGATGATGATGPSGPSGATGPSGASGPSGPQGASGPSGPSGPTGASGASGASGPSGPQGPSDLVPPVGSFTPTQLVQGAILTCASTSTGAGLTTCFGPKLNGLDIQLVFGSPEAIRICNTITGLGFSSTSGGVAASNPHFIWTGAWALSSVGAVAMQTLVCNTT